MMTEKKILILLIKYNTPLLKKKQKNTSKRINEYISVIYIPMSAGNYWAATLALFLVVVLPLLSYSVHAESFKPDRVSVIDVSRHSANILFRGNLPKSSDGSFAYEELMKTLRDKAQKEAHFKLPEDVYLVDVSFLNTITEHDDLKMGEDFFKHHPDKGEFVNWVMIGDLEPPDDVPGWLRKVQAKHIQDWQIDRLHHRIPKLHEMLHTKHDRPRAIYIHCEAGVDRTGEVSGSYYMQYLGWDFHKSLKFDNQVEPRPIHKPLRNAMAWYCWYLHYVHDDGPNDCPA
eukprot:gb/GECH01012018.1/.p1 GENE.gb/GECH01012018.1/~~gb/GECH01012018.1/.p1  ORF type:complete len:287 (+),score=37.48 gb/GECH01012018.1/:1-861(+)